MIQAGLANIAAAQAARDEEPILFRTGDYVVTIRVVGVAVNPTVVEQQRQFVVIHKPTGVMAGKSGQLPDAIRGCVALDREQRIVDADPYSLGESASSDRAQ